MHLSIITFPSGATPPQEKAKLSNSFLHSKLWSHRAQFENESHSGKEMHIKNTRCSFQIRGVGRLHSFPLQNSIKKKKKGTGSSLWYATDLDSGEVYCVFWESAFGLPAFPSPCSPKVPLVLKQVWVLHKHTSHLHLFSWSLQPSEPAEHSPPSVTTTFPLALYMFSRVTVCGANVQEKYRF